MQAVLGKRWVPLLQESKGEDTSGIRQERFKVEKFRDAQMSGVQGRPSIR